MTAATFEKSERRGNLEIRHYERSKIVYNLVGCPLCPDYEFEENEHRWKHFLDQHAPEDAGLTPIGERAESQSLFDATFNETGRTLQEWGKVLWVIIDENGHESSIRVDGDELVVALPDGVAGRDRVTLVDRIETAGFSVGRASGKHEFYVSRPSHGLQSPYRETMGPSGEHAIDDAPSALLADGGQPRGAEHE